jgi:hypothetical protein
VLSNFIADCRKFPLPLAKGGKSGTRDRVKLLARKRFFSMNGGIAQAG